MGDSPDRAPRGPADGGPPYPVSRAPRLFLLLMGVACSGLLAGCEAPEQPAREAPDAASQGAEPRGVAAPGPLSLRDDAGRFWEFQEPPRRIVSLVPAATAILLELGAEARLAGRTDYDRDPALASLPSVGGGLDPSLEVLLSLRPDLVVRFHGPSDRRTPERLDAAGIPHLAVRPDTLGDVFRMVGLLGQLVDRKDAATRLEARLRGELAAVETRVQGAPRPRVVILLGGDPPWVAGGETFMHELLELAGGTNLFADEGDLYAPVSVEEILRRRPDLLLATEGARVPRGLRGIAVLRAPESLVEPGPDLGSAAEAVARLLHPDRFR
jgi:iron complex transport system substrate-binding protein